MELVGQIVSFGAMACIVCSLQQKKKRNLVLCQLMGSSLFAISFFLTGGYAAFLSNVICTGRNVVFSREELSEKAGKIWTMIFIMLFWLAYAMTFWLFRVPFTPINAIVNALPTAAMCIMSIAFSLKRVLHIRLMSIASAMLWIVYSLIFWNPGDIISEVLSIGSSILAIARYDVKKKNQKCQ